MRILSYITFTIVAFIWGLAALILGFKVTQTTPLPSPRQGGHIDTSKISLTKASFQAEMDKYSWEYPHIVKAQGVLESGNFESKICREQNNIFGMRTPKQRLTAADRDWQGNYAKFDDWRSSVTDRALFEVGFIRGVNNEEGYYKKLGRTYAEANDSVYIAKLKQIVEDNEK